VGIIFEEQPVSIGDLVEQLLVVAAQPGPEGEVVSPLDDVDGVYLEASEPVHGLVDVSLFDVPREIGDALLFDHEPPDGFSAHRHGTGFRDGSYNT